MIKIGLTGVHGSGKTTKAEELRQAYTSEGNIVYVVTEVARNCPHPLGTIDAQEYIWYNQLMQEQHAMGLAVDVIICDRTVMDTSGYFPSTYWAEVDVIICDRTVMDNLMYYYAILDSVPHPLIEWDRWDRKYSKAKEWMATYDQVIRLPLNLEWLQAPDPIRPKSEAFARKIDALFDEFVQPFVTEAI